MLDLRQIEEELEQSLVNEFGAEYKVEIDPGYQVAAGTIVVRASGLELEPIRYSKRPGLGYSGYNADYKVEAVFFSERSADRGFFDGSLDRIDKVVRGMNAEHDRHNEHITWIFAGVSGMENNGSEDKQIRSFQVSFVVEVLQ